MGSCAARDRRCRQPPRYIYYLVALLLNYDKMVNVTCLLLPSVQPSVLHSPCSEHWRNALDGKTVTTEG